MEIKELDKKISSGRICGPYFFFGDEEFLLENKLAAIKKKLIDPGTEDFNYEKLDGKKITADEIISAMQTFPVMSEKRMVIVKNCGIFANSKQNDFTKLVEELANVPEYLCIVFVEKSFDAKKEKNLDVFQKHGGVVKFDLLSQNQLELWLEKLFESQGKHIIIGDISYLINRCGQAMGVLYSEYSKLLSYVGERTKITREDIDAATSKSVDARVFDMLDNITGNRGTKVMEELKALIVSGENPSGVLTMLTTRFSELLMVKQLISDGVDPKRMADYFEPKRPPFVVNKLISQSKQFGEAYLKRIMKKGLDYAYEVRTGRLDKWLAVEMYVAELI